MIDWLFHNPFNDDDLSYLLWKLSWVGVLFTAQIVYIFVLTAVKIAREMKR